MEAEELKVINDRNGDVLKEKNDINNKIDCTTEVGVKRETIVVVDQVRVPESEAAENLGSTGTVDKRSKKTGYDSIRKEETRVESVTYSKSFTCSGTSRWKHEVIQRDPDMIREPHDMHCSVDSPVVAYERFSREWVGDMVTDSLVWTKCTECYLCDLRYGSQRLENVNGMKRRNGEENRVWICYAKRNGNVMKWLNLPKID